MQTLIVVDGFSDCQSARRDFSALHLGAKSLKPSDGVAQRSDDRGRRRFVGLQLSGGFVHERERGFNFRRLDVLRRSNEQLGFKADQRDYGMGVQILRELGIRSMRLLSNNPRKLVGIQGYGLSVSEWLPLEIPASESTMRYLKTKKEKLGHKLSSV